MVTAAQRLSEHPVFKGFIFTLILLSAVVTGIETYVDRYGALQYWLTRIDNFIVLSFTVEILLKILAMGRKPWLFFADPWNVFDFIIVAICLIPAVDTHYVAVFRMVRVLRVFRMVNFFPKLRLLVNALLKSIPSMGYVILLLSILFYVYAIIGVFLFGPADRLHFGSLHKALITLFKVLTLEGWTDIMNIHLYSTDAGGNVTVRSFGPFLYFSSFILLGAMIIMNLFIGVIMNSMEESQDEMKQELRKQLDDEGKKEETYRKILLQIEALRSEIQSLADSEEKTKNQRD
jgi:voltage-gated sodium channel